MPQFFLSNCTSRVVSRVTEFGLQLVDSAKKIPLAAMDLFYVGLRFTQTNPELTQLIILSLLANSGAAEKEVPVFSVGMNDRNTNFLVGPVNGAVFNTECGCVSITTATPASMIDGSTLMPMKQVCDLFAKTAQTIVSVKNPPGKSPAFSFWYKQESSDPCPDLSHLFGVGEYRFF